MTTNKNYIPPVAPLYTIMEVDLEGGSMVVVGISPNPGSDYSLQVEAMEMLHESTGKNYVILINTQSWGEGTFHYIIAGDVIEGKVIQ